MSRETVKKTLDTLNSAKSVPSTKLIRGAVSALDATDLYRVTLGSRSSLDLKLSDVNQGANIAVQVFTLNGIKNKILKAIGHKSFEDLKKRDFKKYFSSIGQVSAKAGQAQSLNLPLETGEYYVRVYQRQGASDYSLRLSAISTSGKPDKPSSVPTTLPTPQTVPSSLLTFSQRSLKQLVAPNGTSGNDYAYGTTTDAAGNLYVAGVTNATLGQAGEGFVAQYDSNNNLVWKRSIDTVGLDVAFDVAVDADGSYYVTGATVTGSGITTNSDVFVTKYSKEGSQQWIKTIGTPKSVGSSTKALESGSGIELEGGNVYVTGVLNAYPGSPQGQAFIAKYDATSGNEVTSFGELGMVKYGTSGVTSSSGLAISGGNIYITGITGASLLPSGGSLKFSGGDAFIAGFSSSGAALWDKTLASSGTAQDYSRGIAASGSNLYITGQTAGVLPAGSLPANTYAGKDDGFLAKYGSDGSFQWTKQFGTSGLDQSQAIAIDSSGRIYLTGESDKALFGSAVGNSDAWLAAYDGNGTLLGSTQIGTIADDETYGISVDSGGNVYIAGQTKGAFTGVTSAGNYDAWVARYGIL